jgi:heme A synthase
LFAILIGLFGIATLVIAIRAYRARNRVVLGTTITAALLFTLQSALGAIVVVFDLPPTMVTLHLGTAMLLLGTLLLAAVFSTYKPPEHYKADRVTSLAYVTAALSLVIILTGALVRGSGATLACIDWPLCNGEIVPTNQGQLAVIHMTHRFAVLAFGIALCLLIYFVFRDRRHPRVRILAVSALVTYLLQAAVGAFFVVSGAAPIWGAAHVGLAATAWAVLVVLSALEWMNSREGSVEALWKPRSEALS